LIGEFDWAVMFPKLSYFRWSTIVVVFVPELYWARPDCPFVVGEEPGDGAGGVFVGEGVVGAGAVEECGLSTSRWC